MTKTARIVKQIWEKCFRGFTRGLIDELRCYGRLPGLYPQFLVAQSIDSERMSPSEIQAKFLIVAERSPAGSVWFTRAIPPLPTQEQRQFGGLLDLDSKAVDLPMGPPLGVVILKQRD